MECKGQAAATRVVLGVALGIAGIFAGAMAGQAVAAETVTRTITIKDHKFDPTEVSVPAGQRVKLVIQNQDATAEEFESHSLKVEKVIPGNKTAEVTVGPLQPGTHKFVGEFHEQSAQGVLKVE